MTDRFLDDAARWEAGGLAMDEFEARHPRRDVRGLVGLAEALSAMATPPVSDPEMSWETLRDQLPVRISAVHVRKARRSVVVAVAAATLATTSVAYAAGVGPVRRSVDRVVTTVVGVFSDRADPNLGGRDEVAPRNGVPHGDEPGEVRDSDRSAHSATGTDHAVDQGSDGTQGDPDQPSDTDQQSDSDPQGDLDPQGDGDQENQGQDTGVGDGDEAGQGGDGGGGEEPSDSGQTGGGSGQDQGAQGEESRGGARTTL